MSPGAWVVALMAITAMLFPQEAIEIGQLIELRVRLEMLNLRMYLIQRKMHLELCRMIRKEWPNAPVPTFRFVRIENRNGPL